MRVCICVNICVSKMGGFNIVVNKVMVAVMALYVKA